MFSNGTEYEIFLSNQCERCKYYVDYNEDPANVCEIEERIAIAGALDEGDARKIFPYEWLEEKGNTYICKRFTEK